MSVFAWEPHARAALPGIDQTQALSILRTLDRFGKIGEGNIRKLSGDKKAAFVLRVGNWRIILRREGGDIFRVYSVDNRKDAYRG